MCSPATGVELDVFDVKDARAAGISFVLEDLSSDKCIDIKMMYPVMSNGGELSYATVNISKDDERFVQFPLSRKPFVDQADRIEEKFCIREDLLATTVIILRYSTTETVKEGKYAGGFYARTTKLIRVEGFEIFFPK